MYSLGKTLALLWSGVLHVFNSVSESENQKYYYAYICLLSVCYLSIFAHVSPHDAEFSTCKH